MRAYFNVTTRGGVYTTEDFELEVARALCPVGTLLYANGKAYRASEPVVRFFQPRYRLVVWATPLDLDLTQYSLGAKFLDFHPDLLVPPDARV